MSDPLATLWLPHAWVGTTWRKAWSIGSWGMAVGKHWPAARAQHVARGAVWRVGDRIVAEVRSRRGWPPYEAWIAEAPPTSPAGDVVNQSDV